MDKRNHHYIPQTYLKQWEDSTNLIWLYNFREHTVSHRNKKSIFSEDYLYSITIREIQLLPPEQREVFVDPLKEYHVFLDNNELIPQQMVENLFRYNDFIIRKEDGSVIKQKHKAALLDDILNRKNSIIEDKYGELVEDSWNEVVDFFEKFRSMLLDDNLILPEENKTNEYVNRLLEFILSIYTRNPYNIARSMERVKKKDNVEIDNNTARVVFEKMQLLYLKGERKLFDVDKYDIHLFFTTKEHIFITTDNPAIIIGIKIENLEFTGVLWFPISPNVFSSLSFKKQQNFRNISCHLVAGETAKLLNEIAIENAEECFICSEKIENIDFRYVQN